MKKIIYMGFFTDDATWAYRMAILSTITHTDIVIEQKPYSGNITWSFFSGYDALILERPSSGHDLNIIKLAKQMGLKIICDYDDDCLHIPPLNPMWHFYQQSRSVLMECLTLADEVWVSTPMVKRAYSLLNKNIHVIPNAHNNVLYKENKKKEYNKKTKKVFWRGGQSHAADVYSVANELIKIINKNKKVDFQFIGDRFIYMELNCGDNYQPVSPMPLLQYMEYMHTARPNIVMHPLQDNLFNRGKSNIAFLECVYSGGVFFGNTDFPEFMHPGIFNFNYLGDCLRGAIDSEEMERANRRSWEYIMENLLLTTVNKIRLDRLLNI